MKRKAADKYSKEQLMRAMQAVRDGSTQFAAAKKFGVPRSTLYNKISGKSAIGKKSGPGTVLSTEEEKVIEKWILCLAERGFPVIKRQLLHSIQLYLNANKRDTPFVDNCPGRKWYNNFLKRHPIISKRLSQNLSKSRAVVTEAQLKAWHAEVYKYCEENNLVNVLNDPKRVFNMDEKGFILTPKSEVVLAKRGQKAVYNHSSNDEKECVTALLGGNAAGIETPPMLVYAYKRMPSNILLHLPANWSVGISENGWQTQQTFFDYMSNVFYKWLSESDIDLPVILFIDGHKSHISITLSEFCSAHQIELIALYPNATHVIQPMDVVVFKPLGGSFEIKAKDWRISHQFAKIDKKDIAPILAESIKDIDYAGLLRKGFERCGLFPFNADNINFSRLIPPIAAETSYDQLFIDEEHVAAGSKPTESEQSVLSRLKNLEELIEESTLNMFRLSDGEWKGLIEYTALYGIWKKLYTDASAYVLAEEGTMILDVDALDPEFNAKTNSTNEHLSMPNQNDNTIFVVGENGQLIKSNDTDCILIGNNEIEFDESFGVGDLVEFSACGQYAAAEVPSSKAIIMLSEASKENDAKVTTVEFNQIICNQSEELIFDRCNNPVDMELSEPTKTVNVHSADSKNKSIASTKTFDADAFKKSFLMPKLNMSKKNKRLPKQKQSTVITSEAWKESEKKKLEEKERQEAEKDGRKMERERKKIVAAQVKAAKADNAEKKRIEKAEKEAEKKAKKVTKKVTKKKSL